MNPDNKKLKSVLSTVGPLSCPNSLNFHCHTVHSDGSLQPEDLIKQATRNQLNHIAVTDHHSVDAYSPICDWLESQTCSEDRLPFLWSGIEISCTLRKCLVHVLGLDFEIGAKSLIPYCQGESTYGKFLDSEYVVNSIHEAGGLAILAHPARYRLPFNVLIDRAVNQNFDGGEAWYDYDFNAIWKPTAYVCESIDLQLKSYGLLSTCGTDTHGMNLYGR